MNYTEYTTKDLILNPDFRNWVANPDVDSNKFWRDWLKQYPEKIHELKEAKKILRDLPLEYNYLKEEAVDSMWKNLERSIQEESIVLHPDMETELSSGYNVIPSNRNVFWKKFSKIAATVLLLLGMAYVFTILKDQNWNNDYGVKKEVSFLSKQNPRGHKSTIYLRDGSKVILNANSKLTYPDKFSFDERIVSLEGEAFFEVAKDKDRPFKVQTGNLTTMALGTSFNINTYQDQVHVALSTGKVLVYNRMDMDKTKTTLTPGQDAHYNSSNNELVKGEFDENLILGWKDQTIVFKKASEEDVIVTLENWYNVDIITRNKPSLKWDYSGEFENMALDNVLQSIGFTMDFEHQIKEQNVIITYK
ncbi:MAG: FecR family protein [Cyclobacteriaceae bacterium]